MWTDPTGVGKPMNAPGFPEAVLLMWRYGSSQAFANLADCKPVRSSLAMIRSSLAGGSSSWRWRHDMPFQRFISGVHLLRRVA